MNFTARPPSEKAIARSLTRRDHLRPTSAIPAECEIPNVHVGWLAFCPACAVCCLALALPLCRTRLLPPDIERSPGPTTHRVFFSLSTSHTAAEQQHPDPTPRRIASTAHPRELFAEDTLPSSAPDIRSTPTAPTRHRASLPRLWRPSSLSARPSAACRSPPINSTLHRRAI